MAWGHGTHGAAGTGAKVIHPFAKSFESDFLKLGIHSKRDEFVPARRGEQQSRPESRVFTGGETESGGAEHLARGEKTAPSWCGRAVFTPRSCLAGFSLVCLKGATGEQRL